MTTTILITTIKMIVKYLEVPVPYLLPPFPPPAINFIASHIPPQWILSPSKPLSLFLLHFFLFSVPKRLKELKYSLVQLSSDRVKAGSSQPALSLQSHFRAKGFKRYFQLLKTFFRIQHFKHIFDSFRAVTHCPGCIWAATDRLRSIWVPVRTMLQRCGPGEHHHLVTT